MVGNLCMVLIVVTFGFATYAAQANLVMPEAVNVSCWADQADQANLLQQPRTSRLLQVECDKPPVAWCTSGGGWRAMSSSMGFAHSFAQVGDVSNVFDSISCNSGGCWFLSQFSYDQSFYEGVVQKDLKRLENFVLGIMRKSVDALAGGPRGPGEPFEATTFAAWSNRLFEQGAELAASMDRDQLNLMAARGEMPPAVVQFLCVSLVGSFIGNACEAMASHDFNWRFFIDDMLKRTTAPGFNELPSDTASRANVTGPALLFQTTELASAFLHRRNDSAFAIPILAFNLGADRIPVFPALPGLPLQWLVPGQSDADAGMREEWLRTDADAHFLTNSKVVPTKIGVFDAVTDLQSAKFRDVQPIPERFMGKPSIADIASSSSAAGGFAGSPQYMSELIHFNLPKSLKAFERKGSLFDPGSPLPFGLSEASVCSNALTNSGDCPYPSVRLGDGGFVDNLATAQTVRYLQQRYGISQRVRIVLTDNAQCSNATCSNADDLVDISDLMHSTSRRSGPGDLIQGDANQGLGGTTRPCPQVFDQVFQQLNWKLVPGASEFDRFTDSVHKLQYAISTTQTVENKAFGVKAGTTVDLLIFASRSTTSALDANLNSDEIYTALALNIAKSGVNRILDDWLQRTSG